MSRAGEYTGHFNCVKAARMEIIYIKVCEEQGTAWPLAVS